jgi:hypothetical protein
MKIGAEDIMAEIADHENRLEQLVDKGFTVFDQVLTQDVIHRLRGATDRILDAYTDEQQAASGNQGHIVGMAFQDPVFPELIAWPGSMRALQQIGFDDPRYWSAFIISKEPHTPQTYWHQDWPFWGEPVSYDALPHQLFLMFYLIDTAPENGCLRLIPHSHRTAHPLHETTNTGHDGNVRHQDPATSPAYTNYPEQVNVSVRAGDLVVGDARLLHAANANQTDQRRTVITMWYLPRYKAMPEPLLSAYQSKLLVTPPEDLPAEQWAMIEPFLPNYTGDADPIPWDRVPARFLEHPSN